MQKEFTLYLCRHGETQWNRAGRIQGQLDSPLTTRGRQQAQELAQQISTLPITQIYSSDLGRCVETAQIVNQHLQLPLSFHAELRERHFGKLQGVLPSQHPELWQAYHQREQQHALSLLQAETAVNLHQRMRHFIEHLLRHHNGVALLVTHGEWIRTLYNWLHNRTPWSMQAELPANGALCKITGLVRSQ